MAQTALRNVIEPILEHEFADSSYGFRPQRSTKDALRQVRNQLNAGKLHVLDADIQGFFDEIPHDKLKWQKCAVTSVIAEFSSSLKAI